MDRQAFDTALGLSLKCAQGARAIFLESSKCVALNRARLLENARWAAACNRRRLVREKLMDGRLPHDRPATIAGRPGGRERCAACEAITSEKQLVMEIPRGPGEPCLYLDADCYELWERQRHLYRVSSLH